MRRSRSSFDLSDALVSAESLSPKAPEAKEQPVVDYGGLPLVAFARPESTAPLKTCRDSDQGVFGSTACAT